jgi:hypothetical protein
MGPEVMVAEVEHSQAVDLCHLLPGRVDRDRPVGEQLPVQAHRQVRAPLALRHGAIDVVCTPPGARPGRRRTCLCHDVRDLAQPRRELALVIAQPGAMLDDARPRCDRSRVRAASSLSRSAIPATARRYPGARSLTRPARVQVVRAGPHAPARSPDSLISRFSGVSSSHRWMGHPGPKGMPMRYQATKNSAQAIIRTMA